MPFFKRNKNKHANYISIVLSMFFDAASNFGETLRKGCLLFFGSYTTQNLLSIKILKPYKRSHGNLSIKH